jgi:hypothetical protein
MEFCLAKPGAGNTNRERLTPDRVRHFTPPEGAGQALAFLSDTDAPRLAVRVTAGASKPRALQPALTVRGILRPSPGPIRCESARCPDSLRHREQGSMPFRVDAIPAIAARRKPEMARRLEGWLSGEHSASLRGAAGPRLAPIVDALHESCRL